MENRLKSTTLDVTIGFQFVWFMIIPVQFYTPVISYAYCACTVMKRLHGLITIFSTRMCGVCGMISCKRFQDLHRGLNPIQFIYELKLIYSMLNRTVNFCWFCYSTLIFPLVSSLFFRIHAIKWWWMGLFYQCNQCISMELRHVVHHKSSIQKTTKHLYDLQCTTICAGTCGTCNFTCVNERWTNKRLLF